MIRGFVSYAHDDHRAFEEMCTHLAALERAFGIDFWRDKRIVPGNYWTRSIAAAIEAASIHLLLITPRFLASAYIIEHELPAINIKYHAGDLVLPVIVKRCMWQPFVGALQAAPLTQNGRLQAVTEWKPKALGFDAAREQIGAAIHTHLGTPPAALLDWQRS